MSRHIHPYLSFTLLVLPMLFGTGCVGTGPADSPASIATSMKIAPLLADAARQLQTGSVTTPLTGLVRSDSQGRIQVYVYVSSTSPDAVAALTAHGLQNIEISPDMQVVQGMVKPLDLDRLAALSFVSRITPPRYARPR